MPSGVIHDGVQQDGRRMRCGYVLITGTDEWRTVFRCDEDGEERDLCHGGLEKKMEFWHGSYGSS